MPSYGVAPHECFYKIPGARIVQSRVLPRDQWPDNFMEDPESPGCGTYWCAHCGEGKPQSAAARELDVEAERREFAAWFERADEPNKCCQEAWKEGYRAARSAAQGTDAGITASAAPVSTEQAGDAWIDLKRQKPRDWQQVLVALDNGTVTVGMRGSMGWHWSETDAPEDAEASATHWKPWPAAPSPNNSPVGAKEQV